MLIVTTVSAFSYFIYSLSGGRTGAVLLIFLLSVIMIYLSGGFIPSVFLPGAVQAVGEILPTSYLIRAAGGVLTGYHADIYKQCAIGMCGYTAMFAVAAYLLRRRD